MTFSPRHSVVFVLLVLAACAEVDPAQVPVTMMGIKGVSNTQEMTVHAGETPEAISKGAGMNITQLLEMNGLVAQQKLTPGQSLRLPVPDHITVIEGDTIDSIARSVGVDRQALAKENNLSSPYYLKRGQVLRIPEIPITAAAAVPVATDIAAPVDNTPIAPNTITTTQGAGGEKVHSSASGTITEQDLAPPNGAAQSNAPPPKAAPPVAETTPAPAAPATAVVTPSAPVVHDLGSGVPHFSWPVNGSTLSSFGAKPGGQQNDGLDIGAPLGSPVRAAAAGDVVYTGDNVAGFGTLVLIRHSGGFATAYGHIQKTLVKRGQHVAVGQAIAQIGKTGNVKSPQLHFEIRKGTQAVDPKTYLP